MSSHDGHTVDVGYVHVLTAPGGPCATTCPHPSHQGPNVADLNIEPADCGSFDPHGEHEVEVPYAGDPDLDQSDGHPHGFLCRGLPTPPGSPNDGGA